MKKLKVNEKRRNMTVVEQIKNDKRFYVNPITLSLMEKRDIRSYEVVQIPVGKIRRHLDGKVFSLYKTDVYRYLADESEAAKKKYKEYAAAPFNQEDNPNRSPEEYDKLITNFTKEEYDIHKGIIIINQYNCIMDGQHRCCIMLKEHGEDHIITVLRVKYGDYPLIGRISINNFLYNIKRLFKKEV